MLKSKQIESLSRTLVDESGKPVVTMTSQVSREKSLTIGIVMVDNATVDKNDLTREAQSFWMQTLKLAAQNGMPLEVSTNGTDN